MIRIVFALLFIVSASPVAVVAQEDDEGAGDDIAAGKHRLDLTYLDLETFDTNQIYNVVLFGYTRTFNSDMRAGIRTGIAFIQDRPSPDSPSTQTINEVGPSDTVLTFQYDFSQRLTASPWVPNTLGLNAQLNIPTGDEEEGLGLDTWLLSFGAGWGVNLVKGFWLQPAIGYEFTFSEGDLAVPSRRAYATVPLIWISPSGFWIGYAPTLAYEREDHKWLHDRGLTVGKMFRNGLGLSLDYGSLDRVGPVPAPDDAQLVLNLYYQFGL